MAEREVVVHRHDVESQVTEKSLEALNAALTAWGAEGWGAKAGRAGHADLYLDGKIKYEVPPGGGIIRDQKAAKKFRVLEDGDTELEEI